ncbi:MAG: hypothetical protein WCD76_13390, partial [Pyrinomonadaceae bacterium]
FNDPSDAERFIAADATDIEAALKEVLTQKSYLGKPAEAPAPVVTPTSPTNPPRDGGNAPLTMEAIKGMSATQVAANYQAVMAVVRSQGKSV